MQAALEPKRSGLGRRSARVAQDGTTPLHDAAGGLAAIKALLAAEADVHVKDDVRVGQGRWVAWRARRGGGGALDVM